MLDWELKWNTIYLDKTILFETYRLTGITLWTENAVVIIFTLYTIRLATQHVFQSPGDHLRGQDKNN